jgi:hypothetical protein
MNSKKFTRCQEDFTCEKCGFLVKGNGYTNHCPQCLWSKHVDLNPGDRQATCHGLMEPVALELKGHDYILLHRCQRCGFNKKNKVSPDDNRDVLIKLSQNPYFD